MPDFPYGPGVSPHRPPDDDIWADVLHVGCSHCGVLVDEKCRNTITQKVMPVPQLAPDTSRREGVMRVTIHIDEAAGEFVTKYGVIEHGDPRPDRGQVGHLCLVSRWYAGSLLGKGPQYDDRYGNVTVTSQDDRLFIHLDSGSKRWSWELFEAHFSDGKGPDDMLIGRWPD